jgi:hypothetical protein
MKPSELFRRNMYACMVEEPIGLKLWEMIGEDNIVCETDYPHSDSSFPYSQKVYEEVFDGIPDRVVVKVCHENAERIFDWKMADVALATIDTPWAPPADWARRRAERVKDNASVTTASTSEVCRAIVTRGPLSEECRKPIGPDGRCADGHLAQ